VTVFITNFLAYDLLALKGRIIKAWGNAPGATPLEVKMTNLLQPKGAKWGHTLI